MTLKSDAKFEKNWLVIWKMTWEIWQIFTRALETVQIGTLIGCFCPKQRMYELKIYRGVVCHENEEYKIWRGTDLSFNIDMRNLMNFNLRTQKSKEFALWLAALIKVYNVWAKKSTEKLCLMALKIDAKFEGKLT